VKKIVFFLAGAVAILALAMLVYRKFHPQVNGTENERALPLNLVLISIDTVRTDYLQLYNPKGAPTPNLNRITERSVVFANGISQVPYTLPSHCTMLTGTYPMKHHVQENTTSKLSDSAITLAEVLKQKGYNTAGFIGSIVLASNTGIQQGFDYYDDSFSHENVKREDLSGIQKNADADAVLGEIYLNSNQPASARPYLQRAIENHPDSSSAFVNYSALLASEGKIQEAIQLLETNRQRFEDPDYLIQLGRLMDRAGQVQKEVDLFQTVVRNYPEDPRGFFYLGKIVLGASWKSPDGDSTRRERSQFKTGFRISSVRLFSSGGCL
jgi:tetratricopeptide (TPR) repeat protein